MRLKKSTIGLISLVLIGLLLNSCSAYGPVVVPKETPPAFEGKIVHLIWDSKQTTDNIYMTTASIKDNQLTGIAQTLKEYNLKIDQQFLINVYLNSTTPPPTVIPGMFSIPISEISKIEIYDFDLAGGVVKTVFCIAGIGVLAVGLLYLIVLLTKESCPFIYSYNGTSFELTGEIYSGAIFPDLERNDYLPLPSLKALADKYQLKMANKVQEIQYTNLAELVVIDHPKDTEVLLDKYGKYQTIKQLHKPLSAISSDHVNILPMISQKDSLKYLGDVNADSTQSKDSVILSFARPSNTNTAKLVVRAKNSFWLDHTMGQFFSLFGDKYDKWYEKKAKGKDTDQPNWSQEQGIPLSVYLMKNGEWQFVDYFNIVGPMAERDLVMPIDISALQSDQIKLKLECGSLFWEVDYVGMDFSSQQKVYEQVVPLNTAIDQKGRDVKGLMTRDDKKYYVMPEIGSQASLSYEIPEAKNDMNRSVFLHSKGHYKVLRNAKGKADVAYLKSFREPGKLGQFSRENYLETKKSINR